MMPFLLVRARHAELRRVERLEHRDPPVLVGVGAVAHQRVDEVAAEERRESFRAGSRRRHDRAPGPGQLLEERARSSLPCSRRRRASTEGSSAAARSSPGVMSGPGRLNFAALPSNVPWPISTMNTTSSSFAVLRQRGERPLDLLLRRLARRALRVLLGLFGQIDDMVARDRRAVRGAVHERRGPALKQLARAPDRRRGRR